MLGKPPLVPSVSHDSTLQLWMSHYFYSIPHPDLWSHLNIENPALLRVIDLCLNSSVCLHLTPNRLEHLKTLGFGEGSCW